MRRRSAEDGRARFKARSVVLASQLDCAEGDTHGNADARSEEQVATLDKAIPLVCVPIPQKHVGFNEVLLQGSTCPDLLIANGLQHLRVKIPRNVLEDALERILGKRRKRHLIRRFGSNSKA